MTTPPSFSAFSGDLGPLGAQDTDQSIPLPSPDEEERMGTSEVPDELPILALRNTVLFPGVVLPITLGRDSSLQLVKEASEQDRLIGVVAQRTAGTEQPGPADLYDVGTVAEILKLVKMPDGSNSIIIQGKRRIRVREYVETEPYFRARVEPLGEGADEAALELEALTRSIKELATQIVRQAPHLPSEAADAIESIDSPDFLVHFIASNLQVDVAGKQEILATLPLGARAELVLERLQEELQVLELSEKIRTRVRSDVDEQQREYFLRQQLKAIQEELGETDERGEVEALRRRAAETALPEHAQEQLDRELARLARTNPASPDYAGTRNYVDWILDLPWSTYSDDELDVRRAETVLDEDHYGLADVKERILEHLAVLTLTGDMKAPILCLHGPPGVGKTSLGQSIARAMGRTFVRMSLGGVRDEAEIRGHRRTYVGALPGRILQGLKKAGTNNPVFMLD
jgi:ATP-dependent Lon protease